MPIFVAVPGSHLKYKRNVRTHQQYKKKALAKAQAKHVTVQVQKEDHIQEIDSVRSVENASKHVVLKRKAP